MMLQFKLLSVQPESILSRKFSRVLAAAFMMVITVAIGAVVPVSAQPQQPLDEGTAGSAENLEINGQDPSISLPSAPTSGQVQEEEEVDQEQVDQEEEEQLPNMRETFRNEEQQVEGQEQQNVDSDIPSPGTGSNPEQDSPDAITVP